MSNISFKSHLLATVLALAPALAPALAQAVEAGPAKITQQPHRAVYAMGLASGGGIGGPALVRGVMSYEMVETCDAWRIDTKILMLTSYGEDEVETLRKMSTWESKDGLDFRFRVDESQGGKPGESIRGVAVLDGEGQAGVAEYTHPQAAKVNLPRGTVFPSSHMEQMIRRSLDSSPHFGKVVFDGSSLDDPFVVSAVIGEAPEPKLPDDVLALLEPRPRWSARLAYFPVAKKSETPEFELDVVYRDDGIVESIRQEYDDHAVDSRLHQIELLPRPMCEAGALSPEGPALPDGDEQKQD